MAKITKREIIIPRVVYEKMMYVGKKAAPHEVEFLASVKEVGGPKELIFKIDNIYIIEQTVTAGSTDFSEEALARFIGSVENPQDIWCWIHSHVNMGVFWSGTDTATINRLLRSTKRLLSIVFTLDGKMKTRCDVSLKSVKLPEDIKGEFGKFIPTHIVTNDIEVNIQDSLSDEDKLFLDSELAEKLKVSSPISIGSYSSSLIRPSSYMNGEHKVGKGIGSVGQKCWTCSHALMLSSTKGEFEWECMLQNVDGINVNPNGDCDCYTPSEAFKGDRNDRSELCKGCANLMNGECLYNKYHSGEDSVGCLYYCPLGSEFIEGKNSESVDKLEDDSYDLVDEGYNNKTKGEDND